MPPRPAAARGSRPKDQNRPMNDQARISPPLPTPALPTPAEARGLDLLDRIRAAFVRKGFDAASMQDLAREAGVSVGSFYRYFPSKTAIVEAMITKDIAEIEMLFDQIIASDQPRQTLRAAFETYIRETDTDEGRLWAEVTAASLRQSDVAETCQRMDVTVSDCLLRIFARMTGLPLAECATRFAAHAKYLVLLVKASGMRNAGGSDPALTALVLRSIDHTLDEISQSSPGI